MSTNNKLNKTDYKILTLLYEKNCTTMVRSYTLKDISKEIKLSLNTTRNSVTKLLSIGFLHEGATEWNAKTYYITNKGIENIKEII